MMKYVSSLLFIVSLFFQVAQPQEAKPAHRLVAATEENFINSFLKHFEFSPEGRYVHEYHSLILQQTSESFRVLEQELIDRGLNLHGRFAILGYEENSMPAYYTDFKAAKINDEATTKNNAGWSLKLHNRFGFMTGFALKDVNSKSPEQDQVFEHINVDKIPLFDARAKIFHQHAFGEALPLIHAAYTSIMKVLHKQEYRKVLTILVKFWERLYGGSLKVGNKQVAGTQDILFSIEGAKHLLASPVPLKKYFTGPDITYPIEIFNSQQKEATRHAQAFVKRFVEHLTPRDDEKTVYIFCSFVDGVGKSTMLGNVKNWMKHGSNVELYDHVDNSSSQLADLFQFSDKVYIADLPAQMSHFTFKPDGLVFVDINTEKRFLSKIEHMQQAIQENGDAYEQAYQEQLNTIRDRIAKHGYFDTEIQDMKQPGNAFIRNLILLKKDSDNYWIPFTYEDECFLYNSNNTAEIRCLQPLGDVKSEGLKNIKSEQMLFFDGIRFPFPYNVFMDDLVQKFNDNGIQQVVFVDFLSMYPRSSRENIRVNYLLQQLALIDNTFDVRNSIYHDFVSGGELLYAMQNKKTSRKIGAALELETLVRLILHNLIVERNEGDLTGIGIKALTSYVQDRLTKVTSDHRKMLQRLINEKIQKESQVLEKLYGRSKSYVNIQLLSLDRLCTFSNLMQDFFCNHIDNDRMKALWEEIGKVIPSTEKLSYGLRDEVIKSTEGYDLYECFACPKDCKDEVVLRPMLRFIRASWYASLANVLFSYVSHDDQLALKHEKFLVPACFVKQSLNGDIHVVQRLFDEWNNEKVPSEEFDTAQLFNLFSQTAYGHFMDAVYRLDWDNKGTDSGIYCYDYSSEDKVKAGSRPSVVTKVVSLHQANNGVATVVPTGELCHLLEENSTWNMQHNETVRNAEKNGELSFTDGEFVFESKSDKEDKESIYSKKSSKKIFFDNPAQREGARLFIRMIATLEMIAKDPDASAVIRPMHREDFSEALKMIESLTIPRHLNIFFKENLFDNYEEVEPYPSWEFWEAHD